MFYKFIPNIVKTVFLTELSLIPDMRMQTQSNTENLIFKVTQNKYLILLKNTECVCLDNN